MFRKRFSMSVGVIGLFHCADRECNCDWCCGARPAISVLRQSIQSRGLLPCAVLQSRIVRQHPALRAVVEPWSREARLPDSPLAIPTPYAVIPPTGHPAEVALQTAQRPEPGLDVRGAVIASRSGHDRPAICMRDPRDAPTQPRCVARRKARRRIAGPRARAAGDPGRTPRASPPAPTGPPTAASVH